MITVVLYIEVRMKEKYSGYYRTYMGSVGDPKP